MRSMHIWGIWWFLENRVSKRVFPLKLSKTGIFHAFRKFQEAKNCYDKVTKIQPNHANAHNNLGITLKELGEVQKAKSCYEKAIQINPDFSNAHNNLGYVFYACREFKNAISC